MESSGEYIPPKKIKPADRQGELTVTQKIFERWREKIAQSHSNGASTNTAKVPEKKPAPTPTPQVVKEV